MPNRGFDLLAAVAAAEELKAFQKNGAKAIVQGHYRTIKHSNYISDNGCIGGWWQHIFDRPCLLVPQRSPRSIIRAFPYEAPDPPNPTDSIRYVYRSQNGMLWIPFPGEWWIRYADGGSQDLVCVQLDDTAGMAMEMMKRRRIIYEYNHETTPAVLAAGAGDIIGDDFHRDGVLITNIGPTDIWVRLGSATTAPISPAAIGNGWLVPVGETLELIGDMAWSGTVNAIAEGADSEVFIFQVFS